MTALHVSKNLMHVNVLFLQVHYPTSMTLNYDGTGKSCSNFNKILYFLHSSNKTQHQFIFSQAKVQSTNITWLIKSLWISYSRWHKNISNGNDSLNRLNTAFLSIQCTVFSDFFFQNKIFFQEKLKIFWIFIRKSAVTT